MIHLFRIDGVIMKKHFSIILLIIWMIVIFVMSSFNAEESSNQSGFIVSFIANFFNINNTLLVSLIVRKMAHFLEYFILGILMLNVIVNYNKKIYLAYIFSILYACLDEVHQLFVSGRSGQIMDVLIDSMGIIIGILLVIFVKKR